MFAEVVPSSLSDLTAEAVGFIGGAIFLGSWILQAWETRKAGKPVVSLWFFLMRAFASGMLALEGLRVGSISVTFVMSATMVLMLYNVSMFLRKR